MQYFPEKLMLKRDVDGIVEIRSSNELIAKIDLKHSVRHLSSEDKSEKNISEPSQSFWTRAAQKIFNKKIL